MSADRAGAAPAPRETDVPGARAYFRAFCALEEAILAPALGRPAVREAIRALEEAIGGPSADEPRILEAVSALEEAVRLAAPEAGPNESAGQRPATRAT